MGYYPVVVDMTNRPVVVIGGGEVAQRKGEGVLAAGARGTVVAPKLTRALQRLLAEGQIDCVQREYRYGDLAGVFACFVATDDGAVNNDVAKEGRQRGVWVNASDDPKNCDFILPAI